MKTSVVIPTVNRPDSLKVLLHSLAGATLLPDEVVIIEQGDALVTRRHLSSDSFPFPVLIHAHDEESSATARNRGVKESTGDIIFFFDDDMEVDAAYLKNAVEYLGAHPDLLGLTGRFVGETPRPALRLFLGIFFNVYSTRARNVVLPSGAYDFIRGAQANEEQAVQWMRGGNMVFRRAVFDEGFRFNPHFKKWSFGEDVLLTYQIVKRHPNSLRYLPDLRIRHHAGQGNKMSDAQVLKMKIVYRYIFWKQEVWRGKWWRRCAWLWSQVGLSLLDISQYPSFHTLLILARAYWYLLKNRRAILAEQADYNAFIFRGESALSIFGVFPSVRFRQIVNNPAYFYFCVMRELVYKKRSYRYAKEYCDFRQLNEAETLDCIIEKNLSLIRFGDGEFGLISGAGIYPPDSDWSQRYSIELKKEMEHLMSLKDDKILLAFPPRRIFLHRKGDKKDFDIIPGMHTETRLFLRLYFHRDRIYGSCDVFLPHHSEVDWGKIQEYISNRVVVIVTGGTEQMADMRLGKKTLYVECGKHDAFERRGALIASLDALMQKHQWKNDEVIFWVSLGCTAGSIVMHLSQKGYIAWDTGHIFKFAREQLGKLGRHG